MLPVITTSIPKNVQLQLALVPELPWIEADARQFGQIVKSLVVNGAEAIGAEEGTLRISTGVRARPGVAGNPGRDVYMEVKDSGSGMSEETKARIFDPFFTTKFMGRGLGLAAVAGILRAHNGRMTVESVPGEGATFTVFFPAVEPVLLKVAVSPPFTAARSTDTILFVEDELSLRILAKVVLERSGYSVLLAKNGREGVDLFRQNANEVAIVLMDMMMPVMGGKEAFQLIREIRPDVPVIVLTGYTEDIVRQELGAGASAGFIQKPYSVTRLVTAIRAALPVRGTGCE
jgi:CheY-like chemotaxis protein